MGKRTTARRLAMQAIYQAEVSKIDVLEALKNLTEEEHFIPETIEFAKELAQFSWNKKEEIDQIVKKLSIDWSLDRIGKVDSSILKLAIGEIMLAKTPHSVIINEAVELAKKYSTVEAAKFINGILGAYVRERD